MMTLITAVPGSGKTLRLIHIIQAALKDGRPVYANVDGLNIAGVLPAPDDWRDTPDGSVVIYDECQERFRADGKPLDEKARPDIAAMERHRHTGHDLVFATQHPKLVHSHVRALIGMHHHLIRKYGVQGCDIYSRENGIIRPESFTELAAAEKVFWAFPKDYYGLYKSATIHTHKRRIPRWLVTTAIMGVLVISGIVWAASSSALFKPLYAEPAEEPGMLATMHGPVEQPYERPREARVAERQPAPEPQRILSGCIASSSMCRCYDLDMDPLPLSETQCRSYADGHIPFRAGLGGERRARRGAASRPNGEW